MSSVKVLRWAYHAHLIPSAAARRPAHAPAKSVWLDHRGWSTSHATSAIKPGRLRCSRLLVAKDTNHVWPVTREVLSRQVTRRQQEHHALLQEGKTDALFLLKVVDILLKLALIGVSLRHEGNDSKQIQKRLANQVFASNLA